MRGTRRASKIEIEKMGHVEGPKSQEIAWQRHEARAGRTHFSEAAQRALLLPGPKARSDHRDLQQQQALPAVGFLGGQGSSRRRSARLQKETRASRSWNRASALLLLGLVVLPLLRAGRPLPPRATPGAPGGHRGERVGEATNPGPETTPAWAGLAQLGGEKRRVRLRGKQATAGGQRAGSAGAGGRSGGPLADDS